jgi:flagellar protein FliS
MTTAQHYRSYQTIATQTSPPGQRVMMMYNGAIRFLQQAMEGFQYKDPLEFNQTIHNNITRALAIIREMNRCLDLDQGGELALTLRRLYNFMDSQLMQSNLRKKPDGIQDTLNRLTVLRDAWGEMLRQQAERFDSPMHASLSVSS